MPLVVCADGLKAISNRAIVPGAGGGSWDQLRLFTNNVVPSVNDVLATYTELAAGWYAPVDLDSWGTPAFAIDTVTTTGAVITFTNSGGVAVTVYGYFVTSAGGAVLLWAERDPNAPITLNPGDSYKITPAFSDKNP